VGLGVQIYQDDLGFSHHLFIPLPSLCGFLLLTTLFFGVGIVDEAYLPTQKGIQKSLVYWPLSAAGESCRVIVANILL